MKRLNTAILFLILLSVTLTTQAQTVARTLNEILLQAIREDLARPTVHARNLWHTSAAMYDVWAIMDDEAEPYLIGNTIGDFTSNFTEFTPTQDKQDAINEAISFAMYRLLRFRFTRSQNSFLTSARLENYMQIRGYNTNNYSQDYTTGGAAELGNYIAQQYIEFGLEDGSNEIFNFANRYYSPVNNPLFPEDYGNETISDPNHWQPLTLSVFIDQSGNVIPGNTPPFLSPEWGNVQPFALSDPTTYTRDGDEYKLYIDPGSPPLLDTLFGGGRSEEYRWGFAMVSVWGAHLDPSDEVMWDISPGASGNNPEFDLSFEGFQDFYNYIDGGDPGTGRPLNPKTGQPYEPNLVPRGDYARALAEFWADGPSSETPPGHWFTILNYVNESEELTRRFEGVGAAMSQLEWDIKSYFVLGAGMHDAAVNTWAIKGYYDYVRPVSAIRYMGDKGQSSDPNLPNYHVAGLPLMPGYIELIEEGDPLAGDNGEFVNQIKLYSWKGPDFIENPEIDEAGVGWIRSGDWWPYQRPTFVTPNFAGYVSGHSTFSRAAAELLTAITGDEYFPGGMGTFEIKKNEFLVFEEGPSVDFELQWATYRDASDQTSLSRIWGGIHPPADDLPGREIGIEIADKVFILAREYFYNDTDEDGFYSYIDCDDNNPSVNPGEVETCDGLDNDCNDAIDDGLPQNTFYADDDSDGFGNADISIDTCLTVAPFGYTDNTLDCDDSVLGINPDAVEACDDIDSDCDGILNNGLIVYTYYLDSDADGFGDINMAIDTCLDVVPMGYALESTDCSDNNANINPLVSEICDNIDNNCDGQINEGLTRYTYYLDSDNDGFGDENMAIDTCVVDAPVGFVTNALDCDDANAGIHPNQQDIADNGIDEDCSGYDLYVETKFLGNPTGNQLEIRCELDEEAEVTVFNLNGQLVKTLKMDFDNNFVVVDMSDLITGIYYIRIVSTWNYRIIHEEKLFKQ